MATMTDSQLAAMIAFHRKAERAYAQCGKVTDATAACRMAEKLEHEREQRKANR